MAQTLDRTQTRELSTRAVRETGGDGRTVEVVAVPLGQRVEIIPGMWAEEIAPDVTVTLRDEQSLPMLWRHDEPIGVWSKDLKRTETELRATGRISDTTLGRDVLTLLNDKASTGASIGFRVTDYVSREENGLIVDTVHALELFEISLTPTPAYPQASVTAVRERKENPMPTVTPEDLTPRVRALEDLNLSDTLDQMRASIATLADEDTPTHPLAKYDRFADYLRAVYDGTEKRAAVDQTTVENIGVVPPGWYSDNVGIVNRTRPVIEAFGTRPLPDAGMDVNWPYYDEPYDPLIAQQVTEKTELTSAKVTIEKASEPILTAGFYSDISYQLILRSDPDYLEAYQRILLQEWGKYTEAAFVVGVYGKSTNGPIAVDLTGDDAAKQMGSAAFEASMLCQQRTGAPAEFIVAASDVYAALGGVFAESAPIYGTQNTAGVSQASTLAVGVSGLPVIYGRGLAAGTAFVSNSLAADFPEQGPMFPAEENVARLGRDVGIWGMYVPNRVRYPGAVVTLAATVTAP